MIGWHKKIMTKQVSLLSLLVLIPFYATADQTGDCTAEEIVTGKPRPK